MVGAYTLTMVTYWFLERASRSDMILSLIPLGKLVTFDNSSVRMATLPQLHDALAQPFPVKGRSILNWILLFALLQQVWFHLVLLCVCCNAVILY